MVVTSAGKIGIVDLSGVGVGTRAISIADDISISGNLIIGSNNYSFNDNGHNVTAKSVSIDGTASVTMELYLDTYRYRTFGWK